MKMFYKIAAVALVMVGFSATANAQDNTATGTATATIINPLTLSATSFLEFGEVVSNTGGSVTVDADGGRSVDGEVTLGTMEGSAGLFTVKGDSEATYAVTLPTEAASLELGETGFTMDVTDFTSNLVEGSGTLSVTGDATFTVGAKLNVANGQPAGDYVGTFNVSVDYN